MLKLFARSWVWLHGRLSDSLSRWRCYGIYDGDRLEDFRREHGSVPVLLAIPPMSDVNGALPHPGVRVLQSVLRDQQIACEVMHYNHLIQVIHALDVRILGVSTYSQAIRTRWRGCSS